MAAITIIRPMQVMSMVVDGEEWMNMINHKREQGTKVAEKQTSALEPYIR